MSKAQLIELRVPASSEFMKVIRLVLAGIGNTLGFNAEDIEDIKIAVGEACYNAFRKEPEAGDCILIKSAFDEKKLTITIIQKPAKGGFPSLLSLKDPVEKGIGIILMKHLMDQVKYVCDDSGIQITLVKNIKE
ncbi:MAG: ATP-binding protein [Firmicutes bacterium]|nr:ATP-binding protein [Bacillota bacterium]